MNKLFTGILIGISFSSVLIYIMRENCSLIQVLIGFVLFIFPAVFLSSFKSRTLAAVLTVMIFMFVYISVEFNFSDTWVGALMALIIGLPLYVFKIRQIRS
jgi:hypothetical protein